MPQSCFFARLCYNRAKFDRLPPLEYGATIGFFPVDEKTVDYLKMTDRAHQALLTEVYTRANGLFHTGAESPEYTHLVELDLSTIEPCLAGRVDTELNAEPFGTDAQGQPVYLSDIWPGQEAIDALVARHVRRELYAEEYGRIFDGDAFWHGLEVEESTTFAWEPDSTYIRKPLYFEGFSLSMGQQFQLNSPMA